MEPINVILYFSHDYIFIRVLKVGHTWQYSLTETKKSTKKIEYLRNTLTNEESYRRQLARIYLLISFVLGLFYSVSEDGCSIDRYCSYFFFTIIYFIFTSSCTIVDPCVGLIRKIRTPVAATYPTRDRLMAPAPPPPMPDTRFSLSRSLSLSYHSRVGYWKYSNAPSEFVLFAFHFPFVCPNRYSAQGTESAHWPGYYRLSGRFVMTPEAAILVLSAAHYIYHPVQGPQD